MKEITRVHLAKTPYSIEVDAKKVLADYLSGIERAMHADDEVMQEIEARVVELLAARGVQADGVITAGDVAAVRQQMGEPQEFSEGGAVADGDATLESEEVPSQQPAKRLMRDLDNAWFGGVCAGIAVYLGVQPVWIRLLAVVSPFMTLGASIVLYVLLWVMVPAAQTAAEKLQMRGEAVTLTALKETTAGQSVAKGVNVAAKVIRFVLGSMLLVGTMGVLIALMIGSVVGLSVVTAMQGFVAQPWAWGLLISLMIGGLAAVWLGATLTYSAFSWTLKKSAIMSMITAVVIGTLCISTTAIFGMRTLTEVAQDEKRLTKTVELPLPEGAQTIRYAESQSPRVRAQVAYASDGGVRAEMRYLAIGDTPVPHIKLTKQGDVLVIEREDIPVSCNSVFDILGLRCTNANPEVVVYGKGLKIKYDTASRPY